MTEFLSQHFDHIVKAVRRVVQEPESYIEIKFSVLTLRVYPSRVTDGHDDQVWRLKYLTSFMLALSNELVDEPTRFAFEYTDSVLSVGILKSDGDEVWMPCEIISLDHTQSEPASARFSFPDDTGQPIALTEFRRIRL